MFPLLGFSMGFWDCPDSMEFFPSFIRIELVVIFKYIYIRQKTTNNLCILQYFSSWYFYFLFFVLFVVVLSPVYPMFPISLDCPFLIAISGCSHVY